MPADLTFQGISDKLPAGSIVALASGQSAPAAGVYINAATLTADPIASLSDAGVVEFCVKLLRACAQAQETANVGATSGQRLNAFPTPGAGVPFLDPATGTYYSTLTCSVTGKMPLNSNQISGPQV
jgi:hypothetical protein